MSDFDYWAIDTGEGLTDYELHSRYDEMLNEVYGETHIGYSTFQPADILRELEPITYRVGFSDWIDSELGETITEDEPSEDGEA